MRLRLMQITRTMLFRRDLCISRRLRTLLVFTAAGSIATCALVLPRMANAAYANVPATQTPGLTISKVPSTPSVDAAGQIVTNTFTVTNTGNVTLTEVGVTDIEGVGTGLLTTPSCIGVANPTASCSGNAVTLAPSQIATFTNTYTVTQADLNAGLALTDSATATGIPPSDISYTTPVPGNAQVNVNQNPELTITKSANPTTVSVNKQIVTYTFLVTNSGNVTLSGVNVDDTITSPGSDTLASGPTCVVINPGEGACSGNSISLAPGQIATFTATQEVNQGDIDSGAIKDVATASGYDGVSTVSSLPAMMDVRVQQQPSLMIFTTAGVAYYSNSGQTIPFEFVVQNSGNVTLRDPNVVTGLRGLSRVECSGLTIAPGKTITCAAHYVTRESDVKRGDVPLTAFAVSWTDERRRVTSAPSSVVVPAIKRTVEVTG